LSQATVQKPGFFSRVIDKFLNLDNKPQVPTRNDALHCRPRPFRLDRTVVRVDNQYVWVLGCERQQQAHFGKAAFNQIEHLFCTNHWRSKMKTATAWSTSANTEEAVSTAYAQLERELGGAPDWLAVYVSVKHDGLALMNALRSVAPAVPLHGSTSCLGVMTEEGFHAADGVGLGLFGLCDPAGRYGVGAAKMERDPRTAGAAAAREAIAAAKCPGDLPKLIWLTCAPGFEEEVVRGIEETVGSDVPIVGGSAADNTIAGHWQQFANGQVYTDGVVVTAMSPSTNVHWAFRSGYYATQQSGAVTDASRRTILTIDDRPAAEVYNEWTNGAIKGSLSGGNVLGDTTLHPLGRLVMQIGDVTFYRLSHPEAVTPEGGLRLFTDIETGEEIVLMAGSHSSLVVRAGVVAKSALRNGSISPERVAGGLVIFCAGCMLTIQDDMEDVVANIRDELGENPFLGAFTFGEQGCFVDGANYHGNLMMSVIVFERG
jgi:hypothetical protein